jgi:8-oxo-dGTP diphosphatase
MQKYVLGFAFSQDLKQVILIQKQKPEFQFGKFNGVGGKIEETDANPLEAMQREFMEETGCATGTQWKKFITMNSETWMCECFFTVLIPIQFEQIQTQEAELIVKAYVDKLPANCMRNIHWLIPMALNWDNALTSVEYH